ncbi:hypothetical protein IWX50DRAFT_704564, partial [Phyllosticta citricarpa]
KSISLQDRSKLLHPLKSLSCIQLPSTPEYSTMTSSAGKKKKPSPENLHKVASADERDGEPTVIYGPKTYIHRVYENRHGHRPYPSELNTLRAGGVVHRNLLVFGPSPTFTTSERRNRSGRHSNELKIPKQRKRSHNTTSLAEQSESRAWEMARKKATEKLKAPVPVPVSGAGRQTARRKSASRDEEIRKEEWRRGDGEQNGCVHEDELPHWIPRELYEAFTPPASRPEGNSSMRKEQRGAPNAWGRKLK